MCLKVHFLCEGFMTDITLVRFVPGVDTNMSVEVGNLAKLFTARVANNLTTVDLEMDVESEQICEPLEKSVNISNE